MCQMCRDFFILQSGHVTRDPYLFLTFQGSNEVSEGWDQGSQAVGSGSEVF